MNSLEQSLMDELNASRSPRYLLAVCDQAALNEGQRESIRTRFKQYTYPLLQDPHWKALFPYSPLLVVAQAASTVGHRALLESFGGDHDYLPTGWIVSTVPGDQLAAHLTHATVAYRPQGDEFLLRYFDPLILPILYQHADSAWRDAFMAPIASWWVPLADTRTERWGRMAGAGLSMNNAATPSPLLIDDLLWQALIADPLPHRLLQAIQKHSPSLFDSRCPGVRLARVQALLTTARSSGLTQHDDLHDYVFIALTQNTPVLQTDCHWQEAIRGAVSGAGRLGDLYLALREQHAQRSR